MRIRKAQEKDIPQIECLLRQVCTVHHNGRPDLFRKGGVKYTHDQLLQRIQDPATPVFVAADETDRALGYVFCIFQQTLGSEILTEVKTLYIDDLCVDEQARGRHIGRQLYDFAVQFARQNGCYNLTLNVWSCNPPAVKFYERCGLKPQKVRMELLLE